MKILLVFFSYLLGSIPFGLLITRVVTGTDIRKQGSQNIGATNVFRVVGKKWGILVLLLDALKGYLAVKIPLLFLSDPGMPYPLLLGVSAILGHSFPVWLHFKGGKGVATSLGVFLALALFPTLATFAFWAAVFTITHIISIASLAAALFFPIAVFLLGHAQAGFYWLFGLSLVLPFFIFYTHRANLARILKKEEKRLF